MVYVELETGQAATADESPSELMVSISDALNSEIDEKLMSLGPRTRGAGLA